MGKCNDIVFELEVEKSKSGMESNQENKEKVEKNDKKEEWKDAVDSERNIKLGKGKNQEILDESVDDNYIISEEDLKEIEGEYDEEDLGTADYLDSKGRGEMGSGLGEYLKDIGMYPKLSDEEVLELAKRIKDFGDMEARNKLVSHNLKLVISVAKRYTWSSLSILDLIEEGNLGLMKAAERYDYTKGYKFSTYATWWIRNAIQRGVGDYGRSIRLPMHMLEKVNKVSVVRNNMIKELEREVEPEEIAVRMGMEVLKIKEILGIIYHMSPVSLDVPVGEEGDNVLGDFVESTSSGYPEALAIQEDLSEQIKTAMSILNEKERKIIEMRYGLNGYNAQYTLQEIGEVFGVSRERVRQIESRALKKLRNPSRAKYLKEFL